MENNQLGRNRETFRQRRQQFNSAAWKELNQEADDALTYQCDLTDTDCE
jgi:hypothetical protein